jgi:hypothetical protein
MDVQVDKSNLESTFSAAGLLVLIRWRSPCGVSLFIPWRILHSGLMSASYNSVAASLRHPRYQIKLRGERLFGFICQELLKIIEPNMLNSELR